MVTDKYVNLLMISKKEKFIESLGFICNYLQPPQIFAFVAFQKCIVNEQGDGW